MRSKGVRSAEIISRSPVYIRLPQLRLATAGLRDGEAGPEAESSGRIIIGRD